MSVRINKSAFNIREKLSELERPIGLKGSELMRAETAQEARELVSAGRKNLIINGAMMVDQRYSGSSATVTDDYVLDRFKFKENHAGAASINRDAFPVSDNHPAGFRYAMQIACSTADTSLTSNEHSVIMHYVEGYNIGGTKFGTSNAENMTLSFWVKTNAPGTYSATLKNGAQDRCQIKEYQVGLSGYVWEKVVLTFSGCTDGTWDDDIGTGMKLEFGLAGGQAAYATSDLNKWKTSNLFLSTNQRNFFDSTNNRFFITGIQLEIGNNATEFEHRSYGEELALCERYFQIIANSADNSSQECIEMAVSSSTTEVFGCTTLRTTMRTTPTIYNTATIFRFNSPGGGNANSTTAPTLSTHSGRRNVRIEQSGYTGLTANFAGTLRLNQGTGIVAMQAEL